MSYTENTKSYIAIPNGDEAECFATDTIAEIEVAQAAMREAGIEELPICVGHPECPDSYRSDRVLLADDDIDNAAYAVAHASDG